MPLVKSECKEQKTQQKSFKKAQSTSQCSYNDNKRSARSLDDTDRDTFVSKSKKQESKKCQDNENYSMQDDYMSKKQRKVRYH